MRRNFVVTEIALTDLEKGRIVRYLKNPDTGESNVGYATSSGQNAFGVTDTAVKAGERVDIIYGGIALVEMAQALTVPGYFIAATTDGKGKAVTHTHGGHIGVNRQLAAVGDMTEVLLVG